MCVIFVSTTQLGRYAGKGAVHPNAWRSGVTAELFASMLADNGVKLVDQIDS